MTHDRRVPWWVPIVLAGAISLGSMIYIEANHSDAKISDRLSAVEAHIGAVDATQKAQADKVDHIERNVDVILQKLISWEAPAKR